MTLPLRSKFLLLALSICGCVSSLDAQEPKDRMAWWHEARFGLFLHWGLYSIPAGAWGGNTGHAEWILTTAQIPVERYKEFVPRFNPIKFDAEAWAKSAADAGMKYVVITSKHHDGFALYDSKVSDYDVMATPFQRDILRDLADAVRRHGMTMCFYHSIMDWQHPDYLPRRDWESRPTDGADFSRFRKYLHAQVTELLTNYGPIGVMWFDGEWESTWTNDYGKELYDLCRRLQPNVIVNNRVSTGRAGMQGMTKGSHFPGDFGTPEQEIPPTGLPGVAWETCMTMNDHWGFNAADNKWKSTTDLIHKLCDIASKGGNFLLNVGPTAEGLFPTASLERLAEIGRWMKVHGEAIYGTQASPLEALSMGRCTVKKLPNGNTTLYIHVFEWPKEGVLNLQGLGNRILGANLLSDPKRPIAVEATKGSASFAVGKTPPDSHCAVLSVTLEGAPLVFGTPRISADLPRFLTKTKVTLSSGSAGVVVRYTLDGTEPTKHSPLAGGELIVTESCTIHARSFFQDEPVGSPSTLKLTKVSPKPPLATDPKSPGLLRERFEGKFKKLPNFEEQKLASSTVVSTIDLPTGRREEHVALVFRGAVKLPADDVYTFHLNSDDGSRLIVDHDVLVDLDGLHGNTEAQASEVLGAGWHAIRVEWFNATGGAELGFRITNSAGQTIATTPASLAH